MIDRSEVSNRPVTTEFGTALLMVASSTEIVLRDDPASEFVVNRIRVIFDAVLTLQAPDEGPPWRPKTYHYPHVRRWTGDGDVSWNAQRKLDQELRRVATVWADEHPELLRLADRLNVRATIDAKRAEVAEAERTVERRRAELAALIAQAEAEGIVS